MGYAGTVGDRPEHFPIICTIPGEFLKGGIWGGKAAPNPSLSVSPPPLGTGLGVGGTKMKREP